ncbi:DUF2252 domain-containing protein [Pararobbsia silviterrae]|uniref:DUF2252 domain-containing protein n=1 Tax=Pararobbsia silviterrae TaxID=1792498 RepID=A0A494XDU1_9BURK|nr:DUF2252 domain-containing protein [Pararobbsia silviterrae]RKP48678.1 DUF2252 domain-containing protein [Pararobbsia silviterrae]
MNAALSPDERRAHGRAARDRTPRKSHTSIGNLDRDPIALLEQNSAGRVRRLVALRYGRMLTSPFAFFRGSAIIQAHDLAGTPDSDMPMQICGDCHLSNFGGFATPERTLIFDVNDFDETTIGPWEWDLKRLVASLAVAGRHLGHGEALARQFAYSAAESYREHMAEYAQLGALEIWYARISFEDLMNDYPDADVRKRIKRGMEKASTRTHEQMLSKLADFVDGRWRIRDAPPGVFHVRGASTLFDADDDWLKHDDPDGARETAFNAYLKTLAPDRRDLLQNFVFQDVAFKVVGVGSVGTRCLIMLFVDHFGKPMFLQVKEATKSVVSLFYKSRSPIKNNGERVVHGQRHMQAASDPFLGWAAGPFGRHVYVRQLRDMKISAEVETYPSDLLEQYGRLCGWVLARAHAKAGGMSMELSAYMGKSDALSVALAEYAMGYADQVEKDFEAFQAACRNGTLEARTDADMAADFLV